jgi:Zn-dependent protease/predicted transcriptional regulator
MGMTRAFRIGRVFGIEIEVDWTWFIIFAILVLALSGGLFQDKLPGLSLPDRWLFGLITALLFFSSVLLHELAHSVVARRNGLGITGITLFIFGGVSKMADEPRSPAMELKIAIAGPATSVALSVIFFLLARVMGAVSGAKVVEIICYYLGWVNGMLAAFNLLPGFPLDGGRVLRAGLWRALANLGEATRIASYLGQGLGVVLVVLGVASFFIPFRFGSIWLAFIGWFLIQAAQASYQQLILRQALSTVAVSRIMTAEVAWVPADTTLDQVVHDYVMAYNHPAFPVFDGGNLLGLLCLADIRSRPREQWHYTTARQVVPPLSGDYTIAPSANAWEALVRISSGSCGRLLVVSEGRMQGIVSRTDIMRAMRMRVELGV